MYPALFATLALSAPLAASPALHEQRAPCPPAVAAAFNELDDALADLRADLDRLPPQTHRRIRDELRAVMVARAVAEHAACGMNLVVVPVQPTPPPQLDDVGLAQLQAALAQESFEPGKLRVLDIGLRGICVTPAQARSLLDPFPFSLGKQKAFSRIAPQLINDGMAFTLLDAFTFETDKKRAAEVLASTPPAELCLRR